MNNLFTYAILYFIIAVTIYRIRTFPITPDNAKGQISHAWTLYILAFIHILIGIVATFEYFRAMKHINYIVTMIGVLLFTVGVKGRFWALNTLGKYHSLQIEIKDDHPLIISGPYRYIRHPIYFFSILEVLGCALILNATLAFFIGLFAYTPLLLLRLFLEEKTLIQTFGSAYLKYKETVPCLIPFSKWSRDDLLINE
jgi:protein-S-isoprenylcysteine O-methyltransferase Ste14